jgi:hypothetical protein
MDGIGIATCIYYKWDVKAEAASNFLSTGISEAGHQFPAMTAGQKSSPKPTSPTAAL